MTMVHVEIDGRRVETEAGSTILETAQKNDIHIPTLCHFDGIRDKANCRMCVVEIEGMRTFQPACVTKVRDGMKIQTHSERIRAARKANLELILAHHAVDCHHCLRIGSSDEESLDPKFCEMCFWCDCVRDGFCELQTLAREYQVDVLPYVQREHDYEEDRSLHSVTRNPNKCIKCRRCVDVCGEIQTVHNLSMANRGQKIMVVPELGHDMKDSSCVRCGHCVDVCPVGAVYMEEHKDEVIYAAHSYKMRTAVQISDNILPVLEKLYKVSSGKITREHVAAALHKIGFSEVYSDDYAVSLANQQAEKILDENLEKGPVILSNSPSVKNFVSRFFPDVNVHFYDSPQKIFGRLIHEENASGEIKTVNITNVNEYAAEKEETQDVDECLNARELYRIFLRTGGAPARKYPVKLDSFGETVKTKYDRLFENAVWNLLKEPEEIDLIVNHKELHCAVTHNLGQVRRLLESAGQKYDIIRLCD